MSGDVAGEEIGALPAVEVDYLYAVFAKPVETALEVAAFADDEGSDVELANEAAAIPAGGECGDHDQIAVSGLTAGAAESVCFAVDRRVVLLDAAVVSPADELTGACK